MESRLESPYLFRWLSLPLYSDHGLPYHTNLFMEIYDMIMSLYSPKSKEELEQALDALIQSAHQNGVHVGNGGYELLHEDEAMPDWDLTIYRMKKPR